MFKGPGVQALKVGDRVVIQFCKLIKVFLKEKKIDF